MALSSLFPLPKTLHSSKQFTFFVLLLSNSVTEDQSTETNDRISSCTILLLIEKMNQINTPKLLEIEKEIVREVALGGSTPPEKICRSKSTNQEGVRCQIRCTRRHSSHSLFCFCQMAWQGIKAPEQTNEFPAAPSFSSSKKWIKWIPKTIGNRKRDCAWGCASVEKLKKNQLLSTKKVFFSGQQEVEEHLENIGCTNNVPAPSLFSWVYFRRVGKEGGIWYIVCTANIFEMLSTNHQNPYLLRLVMIMSVLNKIDFSF